jgi:hypothetical protein
VKMTRISNGLMKSANKDVDFEALSKQIKEAYGPHRYAENEGRRYFYADSVTIILEKVSFDN